MFKRGASDEPPKPVCLRRIEQSGPERIRDGHPGNVCPMCCRENVHDRAFYRGGCSTRILSSPTANRTDKPLKFTGSTDSIFSGFEPEPDLRAQRQKTQYPSPPPESPTLLLPVSIVKRPLQLRRLFVLPVPV